MSAPLVSICVPIYNGEQHLRTCLDSILLQTYKNTEIILVDDCSTDNSAELARSYKNLNPRVQFFQNSSNLGLVGNWHKSIQISKGEWIKFVFQDDFIETNCIEKLVCSAKENNSPISISKRALLFDNQTDIGFRDYIKNLPTIESIHGSSGYITPVQISKTALTHLDVNIYGEPTSTLYHRTCFTDYGEFNRHLTQSCDYEFLIRVGSNLGIAYTAQTLATFRVHNTSTSSQNYRDKLDITTLADPLILLHDYLFSPAYTALRAHTQKLSQEHNIEHLLNKRISWLCNKLISDNLTSSIDHHSRLTNICDHLSDYPRLTKRIRSAMRRAQVFNHINRKFLWRFK